MNTRVLILEGPSGQSFFFKEILLAEGLADRGALVRRPELNFPSRRKNVRFRKTGRPV